MLFIASPYIGRVLLKECADAAFTLNYAIHILLIKFMVYCHIIRMECEEYKNITEELYMNLVQQFQNLLDPSTALGAFLISLIASIVCSFLLGKKYQKEIDKQNRITAERAGAIVQDVHKKMNLDTSDEKVKKINSIEVGTVDGTIKQDVDE